MPLYIRTQIARSVQFSELDWVHEFNASLFSIDDLGAALLNWDALDVDALPSLLGGSLLGVIITDTGRARTS